MQNKLVSSANLIQTSYAWHSILTKAMLLFFGIALWSKWLSLPAGIVLTVLWILDGGFNRLRGIIKESFRNGNTHFIWCGCTRNTLG